MKTTYPGTLTEKEKFVMTLTRSLSKKELEAEFRDAIKGLDPEIVDQIKKGCFVDFHRETPKITAVRRAWARYHAALRIFS